MGDTNDALTWAVAASDTPNPKFLFRGPDMGAARNVRKDGQQFVVAMPKN